MSSNANATHQWTPIKVLKFAVFRLSHPTLQRPLDEEPNSGGDWTMNHRCCRWLVRNWHLSWFWPIASWCVDHLEQHTAFRLVAVTSLFVHRNAIFFPIKYLYHLKFCPPNKLINLKYHIKNREYTDKTKNNTNSENLPLCVLVQDIRQHCILLL